MLLFAVSSFLSSFLLFQIQPMIGKFILPWFGGTPAVWSTAMLLFQLLLIIGYAYGYWLTGYVKAQRQAVVHVALIAFALLLLILFSLTWESPVTPDASWKPENVSSPIFDIFKLLTVSVGLPYFILASNAPLMQAWFTRFTSGRSYARLYALSNLGSLLGLLAYPILIEPSLSIQAQGWIWAGGFMVFGTLAAWIAVAQSRYTSDPAQPRAGPVSTTDGPSFALISLWIILSATGSSFLLSVTNQITQEVAVIPFLWVLPLALYLVSFILTFSGKRGYHRGFYAVLFLLSGALTLFVMLNATTLHVSWQILAYCSLLFSACMLCHGELYRLRPVASHLTMFYLMISIGGALGGIFVTLIAPLIFDGYWEFFVCLAMTTAILLTVLRRRPPMMSEERELRERARFVLTVFLLVTVMLAVLSTYFSGALFSRRNFYGVVRVHALIPEGSTEMAYVMSHGITVHGLQFIDSEVRHVPTTYYVPESGAGLAILHHPKYESDSPMRVGLLGLGVGTFAAYGRPGDTYRLYEINPVVAELAQGQGDFFSFVPQSAASTTTALGDARISLERELAQGNPQNFDVLVLDTFSSDSIPVHLLTREAFAVYLAHLASDGIIAAHITNLHLDLQPVFWKLAQVHHLRIVRVDYDGDANGGYASHWILLGRDPAALASPAIQEHSNNLSGYSTDLQLWTDDYSNLFQILK